MSNYNVYFQVADHSVQDTVPRNHHEEPYSVQICEYLQAQKVSRSFESFFSFMVFHLLLFF